MGSKPLGYSNTLGPLGYLGYYNRLGWALIQHLAGLIEYAELN